MNDKSIYMSVLSQSGKEVLSQALKFLCKRFPLCGYSFHQHPSVLFSQTLLPTSNSETPSMSASGSRPARSRTVGARSTADTGASTVRPAGTRRPRRYSGTRRSNSYGSRLSTVSENWPEGEAGRQAGRSAAAGEGYWRGERTKEKRR